MVNGELFLFFSYAIGVVGVTGTIGAGSSGFDVRFASRLL
mgnify:CR=1 FL=1